MITKKDIGLVYRRVEVIDHVVTGQRMKKARLEIGLSRYRANGGACDCGQPGVAWLNGWECARCRRIRMMIESDTYDWHGTHVSRNLLGEWK